MYIVPMAQTGGNQMTAYCEFDGNVILPNGECYAGDDCHENDNDVTTVEAYDIRNDDSLTDR